LPRPRRPNSQDIGALSDPGLSPAVMALDVAPWTAWGVSGPPPRRPTSCHWFDLTPAITGADMQRRFWLWRETAKCGVHLDRFIGVVVISRLEVIEGPSVVVGHEGRAGADAAESMNAPGDCGRYCAQATARTRWQITIGANRIT